MLILMNLCMGTSSMESIIGLKRCSSGYWGIQIAFFVACIFGTVVAVRRAQYDQALKLRCGGTNVTDCDIRYDNKKRLTQLLVLGFLGGWIAGALGLGGGSIYNPALLALGIPPKVSAATGLYLVTFSKVASVLIYFLNGQLDLWYSMWIAAWSTVGMLLAICAVESYMKKSGRQSIIVWCLVVVFAISVIAIPIFGGISLKKEAEEGLDLTEFFSLCSVDDEDK